MGKLQARSEAIINAPISKIWAMITDITILHKINPGVIKARGTMDRLGGTRTCEMDNKGRKGSITEKLVELVPEKKTVWAIENDTMGMSKMLKDARFCFYLEKIDDNKTKIVNESFYEPATFLAKIMNAFMMKKMMGKMQTQILSNIKLIAEK